jgi:hypothetical protein
MPVECDCLDDRPAEVVQLVGSPRLRHHSVVDDDGVTGPGQPDVADGCMFEHVDTFGDRPDGLGVFECLGDEMDRAAILEEGTGSAVATWHDDSVVQRRRRVFLTTRPPTQLESCCGRSTRLHEDLSLPIRVPGFSPRRSELQDTRELVTRFLAEHMHD